MDRSGDEQTPEEAQDRKPFMESLRTESSEDAADDEILDYTHEIPPPGEDFLHVCAAIDLEMSEEMKNNVWAQLCVMAEKVDLDNETIAYVACAFYCVMLEMDKLQQKPFSYSMVAILKVCSVSVVEFFDKLSRWIEIATASKKFADHARKIESSLSVSFVIFKKLLPIFRSLFQHVPSDSSESFDSGHLFSIIWLITVIMRKSLPSEDLISSFHLLLCVVEWVYKDLCFHECENHIEPVSVEHMMEMEVKDGVRVLEILCCSFDGVLLDAKHFRTHWFNPKRESILPGLDHKDLNIASNYKGYLTSLNEHYEKIMLRKGEMDERLFLPSEAANVFEPDFDATAVELLRRGSVDTRYADAELLLTMSTQNCLEKLAETKRSPSRNDAKSYVISSQQLRPLYPITQADHNASLGERLSGIVPSDYKLDGSALERYCFQTKDNPLSVIELSAYMIGERFVEKVTTEDNDRAEAYDATISQYPDEHRKAITTLFYVLVEHIVVGERKLNPDRDFQGLLRKEEFLSAVYCCAMELVLFVQESERVFPWCLEVCGLQAVSFQKIIEVVVRNEPQLTREMARHLNKLEERILEELAWTSDSPLWTALSRKPDSIPTCEEAWGTGKGPAASLLTKRTRHEGERVTTQNKMPPCNAQTSFFCKLYYLASMRLSDICERIRVDERGRRMMWTLLEFLLKEERSLFMDRHIDQNLLCIVYVVCKANKANVSFLDIVAHYRSQPQARSHIYRKVRVDSSVYERNEVSIKCEGSPPDVPSAAAALLRSCSVASISPQEKSSKAAGSSSTPEPEKASGHKVDLIVYYNKVFLPRVEDFVTNLSENASITSMPVMPVRRLPRATPTKRMLSDKVSVTSYNPGATYLQIHRSDPNAIRYRLSNQSPGRDFRAINRLLNRSRPLYKIEAPSEISSSAGYRIVMTR